MSTRACLGLLLAAALVACGGPAPGSVLEHTAMAEALAPFGFEADPADVAVAELGWQAPPPDCPHAYRLTAHYEPALRFEDDSTAHLIVGRHPRQKPQPEGREVPVDAPIPPDMMVPAHLFYMGIRAERRGTTRDVDFSRTLVGPAAPTAACMPTTWDPMEDAFALGWPGLTGRPTAVGETWNGLRVGGKCNRSACVDPKTGGGGPDNHHRPCTTPPWKEQLAGLFEHDGELYAWLYSEWSDGHDPSQGITTTRKTLISVEHGRPVWSQTKIDHRFAQQIAAGGLAPIVRTWTLASIDACPGSLAAAGWERPPEVVEEEAWLRDRLAHTDDLRQGRVRAPSSPSAAREQTPSGAGPTQVPDGSEPDPLTDTPAPDPAVETTEPDPATDGSEADEITEVPIPDPDSITETPASPDEPTSTPSPSPTPTDGEPTSRNAPG